MAANDHVIEMLSDGIRRIEGKVDRLSEALIKLAQVESAQSSHFEAQQRLHQRIDRLDATLSEIDVRIDVLNSFRWQFAGVVGVLTFLGTLIGSDVLHALIREMLK